MKTHTGKVLIFVGLYILIGGASVAMAQQRPPALGSYYKIMKTDAGALSAAKFAVKQERRKKENRRLSLASIERAEAQTVAGKNYKVCMKVINAGKIQDVTAVVYVNLKNKFSLTSWEKGVCKIADN